MSKFDFVKRSELPAVFESDVTFLEGIMNYLGDKKEDISVSEDKENIGAYKIKRMPSGFSRAQRNKTCVREGKYYWTIEIKRGKQSVFMDDIPEDKLVWELVQANVNISPDRVVLLDVEGREWPVDVADTVGSVLGRKMCVLEFPTFVVKDLSNN